MTPIINLEGKVGLITGIANEKSISTGVAEACALKAAGPGAILLTPRVTSADRLATCAIAKGPLT